MLNYYAAWCNMEYWRLLDALNLCSMFGALSEGHTNIEDHWFAFTGHTNKVKSYIERDAYSNQLPGNIIWIYPGEENYSFTLDNNGFEIECIDYVASTVKKRDFIQWAIQKKLPVPDEFVRVVTELTDEKPNKADKELIAIVRASINAGYLCENYGSKIKKEQIYEKVNKLSNISSPKFELIWTEIPDSYKLDKGSPPKAVDRAIKAAVLATVDREDLDMKDLHGALKKKLKGLKINIENEHFEIIMKELKAVM